MSGGSNRPFDRAVVDLLRSEFRMDAHRAEVIAARLGVSTTRPPTLEVAGERLGLTRERVRQVAAKVEKRWASSPPDLPGVAAAVTALARAVPLSADDAARLVIEHGLTETPVHPAGLKVLAERLDIAVPWEVDRTGRVYSPAAEQVEHELLGRIESLARPFGFYNLETTVEEISQETPIDRHQVRESVDRLDPTWLDHGWYWLPVSQYGDKSYPAIELFRLVLVAARQPVRAVDLRDGLRRRARFRQKTKYRPEVIPNGAVIQQFCAARPEFTVDAAGRIGPAGHLDGGRLLTGTNAAMVEVLDAAGGALDRKAFRDGCLELGVNPNTFSVYSTYSPVIDHPALNVWTIRGRQIDPLRIEAIRSEMAKRPRKKRILDYGWTTDGRVEITTLVAPDSGGVVNIPAAMVAYVGGRRFTALNQRQNVVGEIAVDEGGTSWGYGPFLSRVGADSDDHLIAQFDLVAGEVTLRIEEPQDDAGDDDRASA